MAISVDVVVQFPSGIRAPQTLSGLAIIVPSKAHSPIENTLFVRSEFWFRLVTRVLLFQNSIFKNGRPRQRRYNEDVKADLLLVISFPLSE